MAGGDAPAPGWPPVSVDAKAARCCEVLQGEMAAPLLWRAQEPFALVIVYFFGARDRRYRLRPAPDLTLSHAP